jgi:hypothetical protein
MNCATGRGTPSRWRPRGTGALPHERLAAALRTGPRRDWLFLWALQAEVWVRAEGRLKRNEVAEEAGLSLPLERLRPLGARQIAPTLLAHKAPAFLVELEAGELDELRASADQPKGTGRSEVASGSRSPPLPWRRTQRPKRSTTHPTRCDGRMAVRRAA